MWMMLLVTLLAGKADLARSALCEGSQGDPPVRRVNGTIEIESTNETSQEWIFESDDFMTVSFPKFDLSGPDCGDKIQLYEKVKIKAGLDGGESVSYTFCKGRRPPDDAMSSKGRLHVAYCNRYPKGVIKFTVTPGCTAEFLVQEREKKITVKKSAKECWITLRATNLMQGHVVIANFSNVHAKSNKKAKCQRSYISAHKFDDDGSQGESLLPNGKKKECYINDTNTLVSLKPFFVKTDSGNVNISYKSVDFTLTFWEGKYEADAQKIPSPKISPNLATTASAINATTLGANVEEDTDNDTGLGLIVALGCGGIFILLVIIGTLIYLKKRATRSTTNSTKRKVSRDDRPLARNGGDDEPRNPSIGSLSNAMYGQMVCGDEVVNNGVGAPEGLNESRKQRRLAELEEKYGPFSETADNHKQSQRLVRKNTRPQLPPPTTPSAPGNNMYETIDDIQVQMQTLRDTEAARPCSYATLTSDEFSDDEESVPDCIDPVVPESNYASILDGPSVSYYDPVDVSCTIPCVEYSSDSKIRACGAQHLDNLYNKEQSTPKIEITSPMRGYSSVASHIDSEPRYQKPRANRGSVTPNLPQAKSQGSLPTSRIDGSVGSSLQEDSENYLRPRPSCPDTMVTCAYSSTEDVSEIRRRLLAAAHPTLLQGSPPFSRDGQGSSETEMHKYDSPRPSHALTVQTEHQYASPRRKGDT